MTGETMWVRAKEKVQISAAQPDLVITQSIQQGSMWLAFHEPDVNPALPWRLNHKHLNVRMDEARFLALFEEKRV